MSEENTIDTVELAQRINRFAVRRGWSKGRLCREYPALGSERTFRDMMAGRCDGYDVANQIASLKTVWAEIEEVSGDGHEETIYDDLTPVASLNAACLGAMKTWGINRVVIVLAEPGCGKTTSMRRLEAKYTGRIVMTEASDVWADRPSALLSSMLEQLGEIEPPVSAVAMLRLLQKKLNVTRKCMVIDEAHHLGPHCLNTIKTLVNTTPGEFVMLAIPSLWAKLNKSAYIEAKQLSTNRLYELVQIDLEAQDIATYMRHRLPKIDRKVAKDGATLMRPTAVAAGNMSFVRDCCDELECEPEITTKTVADAISVSLAKRQESRRR